jgi:taurine dioxygenase
MTTIALEDMTEAESKPLLEFLYAHAARPEFTCRFRWRAGSVAFWDNRCCQHLAINDTWNFPRRMRRFQIAGEAPV